MTTTSDDNRASIVEDYNFLVVSDLHLTLVRDDEDRATSREFARFLDHYRTHRQGGRPWHLVVAGDLFDFVYPDMQLFLDRYPEPHAPRTSRPTAFLAHWDVKALAWRLRKTMLERPGLFGALGHFLHEGNALCIIRGNHDVELFWGVLKSAFLATLETIAATWNTALRRADIEARVRFCDWFFYQPGCLYVEHGNQYDEFNALPDVLEPELLTDPDRAFMPLGSRLTHYLTNAFPEYKPRPGRDFQQHVRQTGQLLSRKYLVRSSRVMAHAMANAGLFSEEGFRIRGGRDDEGLEREGRRWGLGPDPMFALRDLQETPTTAVSGFFFNRMLLDRLFVALVCLGVLAVGLLAGILPMGEPALLSLLATAPLVTVSALFLRFKVLRGQPRLWPLKWLVPPLILAGTLAGPLLVEGSTLRTAALPIAAGLTASLAVLILPFPPAHDLGTHLAQRAGRISTLLDVPVVVMGHHHKPMDHPLGDGRVYFNTGAWVNTGLEGNHAHVVIVRKDDGTLRAALYRGRHVLGSDEP